MRAPEEAGAPPTVLSESSELGHFSFFQRGTIREMLAFFSKSIVQRTQPTQRQTVQHEEYNVHVYVRADGLAGVVTADLEYPPRVAFVLLGELLEQFSGTVPGWQNAPGAQAITFPYIQEAILKYQNPAEADSIMRIQTQIDDTRDVLHNTIDNLLTRGEKLDALVEKSDELSAQSKLFYRPARKTNSCCVIS